MGHGIPHVYGHLLPEVRGGHGRFAKILRPFMPLQTKTETGLTMMSNLDICASPPPIATLGRKSSGSYGSKPLQLTCLFVTFPPGESENHDKSLSLKEHALTLITAGSVPDVPLPTSAPNVEVSTQLEIVQREGSNQPRALSLVEQQRLARLLESNPVTPVRIDVSLQFCVITTPY